MTYDNSNWGNETQFGVYPDHPFVGKLIKDILPDNFNYKTHGFSKKDIASFKVKDLLIYGTNEKGYWGTINGDWPEDHEFGWDTDLSDGISFYAESDNIATVVYGGGEPLGSNPINDRFFVDTYYNRGDGNVKIFCNKTGKFKGYL